MITERQFTELSQLLKGETAVVLEGGKEYLVEARLSGLAREEGFKSLSELIDAVLQRHDAALNRRVLLALTTNETSFFRDANQFELLRTTVLPALIKSRAQTHALTFWSAACSYGQEPYSIAMLIKENFPELEGWNIQILASDINPEVVGRGRAGCFSGLEVARGLPELYRQKYFTHSTDGFQIGAELRQMVRFFEQNLIAPWTLPQLDLIMMRNVLIYFETSTKRLLFERVKSTLAADGYLFLGTAETPFRISEGFQKVAGAASVYRLGR